jgi:hypothetical protein
MNAFSSLRDILLVLCPEQLFSRGDCMPGSSTIEISLATSDTHVRVGKQEDGNQVYSGYFKDLLQF